MKIILLRLLLLNLLITNSFAQTKPTDVISLEGVYQGKNIFVRNAYGPGGIGYCVNEILVNGEISADKINSDIFEINLEHFKLKTGDKVKVDIKYYTGSTPVLINPGALIKPPKTMKTRENSLTIDGFFKWQNLYIYNPATCQGNARGVKQVLVNDKEITLQSNSEIFEIDLAALGLLEGDKKLNDGDKIKIEIKYLEGSDPVIINPEAIRNN